jgi:hypothetical protein
MNRLRIRTRAVPSVLVAAPAFLMAPLPGNTQAVIRWTSGCITGVAATQ